MSPHSSSHWCACPRACSQNLTDLNLTGFTGAKYDDGLQVAEVNARLQLTPYTLYGWQVSLDPTTCTLIPPRAHIPPRALIPSRAP